MFWARFYSEIFVLLYYRKSRKFLTLGTDPFLEILSSENPETEEVSLYEKFKRGFVIALVGTAVRLRECPSR